MNWLKELIQKLTPCNHEYEVVRMDFVYAPDKSPANGDLPHSHKYTHICKKCAKIKTRIV